MTEESIIEEHDRAAVKTSAQTFVAANHFAEIFDLLEDKNARALRLSSAGRPSNLLHAPVAGPMRAAL
jgi:hypothetical protein